RRCLRGVDTDEIEATGVAGDAVPRRLEELVRTAERATGAHRAVATRGVGLVGTRAHEARVLRDVLGRLGRGRRHVCARNPGATAGSARDADRGVLVHERVGRGRVRRRATEAGDAAVVQHDLVAVATGNGR